MEKKKFISKLIVWIIFAAVIPILAIIQKYSLFDKSGDSQLKFSGWGIIAIAIIGVVVIVGACYILKRIKWSMTKQVIVNTAFVVFPLFLVYLACGIIANNIVNIKYILLISIISEFIGGFVNPLPEYIYLKNVDDIKEIIKK